MNVTAWFRRGATALACCAVFGGAQAQQLIYENSAGSGMTSFNIDGSLVKTFTQDKGNGRGIVVVGDTIYYTIANSGNIFTRRVSDNVDTGIAFSVAGASGLQAISYDGTNFWVGDYSGTTKAYLVSGTNGSLLKTITLTGANTEGYYDGLEFFNGKLIAAKYDGGFMRAGGNQYSIFDLDGGLIQKDFINTNGHGNGTGIAFDGTNFFVADIGNNKISQWDGTTGSFIKSITLAGSHFALEDLSVDFAGRVDTCGGPNQPPCNMPGVPEPSTYLMMGLGLAGIGFASRRRMKT
jgi:hypothetical protein